MKKEKHLVFRWGMAFFILLLLIGVAALIISMVLGDHRILPGPVKAL